jgi:hypothetical protein
MNGMDWIRLKIIWSELSWEERERERERKRERGSEVNYECFKV